MTEKMEEMREKASRAKRLYFMGKITRKEAKEMILPYEEEYNRIAKEKAKKYNQRFKPFSFSTYMRSGI